MLASKHGTVGFWLGQFAGGLILDLSKDQSVVYPEGALFLQTPCVNNDDGGQRTPMVISIGLGM